MLVFGSILSDHVKANDFDVIIVVKKIDSNLKKLMKILLRRYKKIDFDLFTEQEVAKDLSFYTREFKLEYLSKGLCIYGKNIFLKKWEKVTPYQYKQSLLIRNIEYLQLVRQKYFSDESEFGKIAYLKKYFLRIIKSILLYLEKDDHGSVNKLNFEEIVEKLFEVKAVKKKIKSEDFKDIDCLFSNFEILSSALVKCKEDFNLRFTEEGKSKTTTSV